VLVYDKVQQTLTSQSAVIVSEVASRINNYANRTDFDPLFVLKVTWHECLMWYERYTRGYVSMAFFVFDIVTARFFHT